ncbi:hypothetical protein GGI19_007183 [Coemansia pectinata]|uniref:CUE domain-containing protein n=1 Tax=Coemansia pectinata TaxID=1052879 RepID=A0A9W8GT18_9FUNG|nr:hypothetical protein GGI19_007183 [Coemansia pectinata]
MSDDYTLNLQQLAEMFPDMDREVVDIVLRDSAGLLEPATNVLLSMNDLEFKPEEEVNRKQFNLMLSTLDAWQRLRSRLGVDGQGAPARVSAEEVRLRHQLTT